MMARYMVRYSPIEMVVGLAYLNWTLHTSVTKLIMTQLFAHKQGQKQCSCLSSSGQAQQQSHPVDSPPIQQFKDSSIALKKCKNKLIGKRYAPHKPGIFYLCLYFPYPSDNFFWLLGRHLSTLFPLKEPSKSRPLIYVQTTFKELAFVKKTCIPATEVKLLILLLSSLGYPGWSSSFGLFARQPFPWGQPLFVNYPLSVCYFT